MVMIEVKTFRDPEIWYNILKRCFGDLEKRTLDELRAVVDSPSFDPKNLLLAEVEGSPAGCLWIRRLPKEDRYELWDLAVPKEFWGLGVEDALIERALDILFDRRARLARAHTLSIEPCVAAFKRHGFNPVRRILRIVWELQRVKIEPPCANVTQINEVGPEDIEELSGVFLEGLKPYWNWWIEDQGGAERLREASRSWFEPSSGLLWLVAKKDGKTIGLTGFHVKGREGVLFGVMVLPEHRLKGVGRALLMSALRKAAELGLERLIVYTVAYLDRLAPGAALYMRSGGLVEAEYIHLERILR